jgi:hypothetical protein
LLVLTKLLHCAEASKRLRHSLAYAHVAGVSEPAALAKLPEPERQSWEKFWTEVAALLAKVGSK